jgi:hypothetical protein
VTASSCSLTEESYVVARAIIAVCRLCLYCVAGHGADGDRQCDRGKTVLCSRTLLTKAGYPMRIGPFFDRPEVPRCVPASPSLSLPVKVFSAVIAEVLGGMTVDLEQSLGSPSRWLWICLTARLESLRDARRMKWRRQILVRLNRERFCTVLPMPSPPR